jgi:hypothetical protein
MLERIRMSLSLAGSSPIPSAAASRPVSPEMAFAISFGTLIFAAILWLPVVLRDPDTLWHITTGEWILAHRAVPYLDTYSFTRTGQPWMAQEWLSEVIMALAYRWAAWNGLLVMTAGAAGSVIGIIAYHIRRHARFDIATMLVVLAAACAGPSLLSRPHVVALPCVALWTVALVSARVRGAAPSLFLLPLMTLWANLHGSFMVGLVLTGAFAVEAAFDPACRDWASIRRWGIFGLGAVVAAAITPHGIDTLLFPFRLLAMRNLNQILEWKPSDFSHLSGMTVSILVALYLGLSGTLRLPKFRVLLLAGLLFATMQHVRNAQLFGVIAPLLIADSLGRPIAAPLPFKLTVPRWVPAALFGLIAAVSLGVRIGLPLERIDEGNYASAALASVPADLRAKPVLNEYGFGGLLIFEGVRPFIDGRADLYGDDFMELYLSIVRAKADKLDEVLCRYSIEWTMFGPDSIVPSLMDRTQGWRRLYSDKVAVIHVRDPLAARPPCPDRAPN